MLAKGLEALQMGQAERIETRLADEDGDAAPAEALDAY